MPLGTFTGIVAAIGVLIAFQIVYCYFGYRRRKSDEVWHVNPEELNFSHPVEVIGQGAFGVVLAAEYRGTRVAIKRVIPAQEDGTRNRASSVPSVAGSGTTNDSKDLVASGSDLVEGADSPGATPATSDSRESGLTSDSNLSDILGGLPIGRKKTRLQRWLPSFFKDELTRTKLSILGSATGGSTNTKSMYARLCFRCDETYRRQEEFKTEMRLLSRLRHPCKYANVKYCVSLLLVLLMSFLCGCRYHNGNGRCHDWRFSHDGNGAHGKWITVRSTNQIMVLLSYCFFPNAVSFCFEPQLRSSSQRDFVHGRRDYHANRSRHCARSSLLTRLKATNSASRSESEEYPDRLSISRQGCRLWLGHQRQEPQRHAFLVRTFQKCSPF